MNFGQTTNQAGQPWYASARKPRPLPMTSMIDVVFLLLIFFMVTSNMSEDEQELASSLSAEGRGAEQQDLLPQIVDVRMFEETPVFMIGSSVFKERAGLETMLANLPKGPGVVVRVSGDVPVWAGVAAMQAAADAGFWKRSYVPAL